MRTKFAVVILPFLVSALPLCAGTIAPSAPVVDQTGNLLTNGNFESGSSTPVTSGVAVSAASALSGWNQWANSAPSTTSSWVTSPVIEGTHTAGLQGGADNGLFQYASHASGAYTVSGWIYAVAGSAKIGLAYNGGAGAVFSAASTLTGVWQYLSVTFTIPASTSGALVYGAGIGNNQWYAEGLWLNAGATSTSPFAPSAGFNPNAPAAAPETGSSAVLLSLALGSLFLAQTFARARVGTD